MLNNFEFGKLPYPIKLVKWRTQWLGGLMCGFILRIEVIIKIFKQYLSCYTIILMGLHLEIDKELHYLASKENYFLVNIFEGEFKNIQ